MSAPDEQQKPALGSVPLPDELYLWTEAWPRWHGTPDDIGAIAAQMLAVASAPFPTAEQPWVIFTVAAGLWAGGANTPAELANEIRVRRPGVAVVGMEVLVLAPGQAYPLTRQLLEIPTREYVRPNRRSFSEASGLPVHISVLLQSDDRSRPGATLEVRSPTGLSGEQMFSSMRAYVGAGGSHVGRRWPASKVPWLFPRLEITADGRPKWRVIGTAVLWGLSVLGSVAGVAALAVALSN